MQDNIKYIFNQNVSLLEMIEKSVFYFRTQNFDRALRGIKTVLIQLNDWIVKIINEMEYFNEGQSILEANYIVDTLKSLHQAQDNNDYILLADIYESQLAPIILNLQYIIMNKEGITLDQEKYLNNLEILKKHDIPVNTLYSSVEEFIAYTNDRYLIEYTSNGQYTIAIVNENGKLYYHSNNSITKEAFQLAQSWYSEDVSKYVIYGLGFGYHIIELLKIDKNIEIEVYESDLDIIQLACAFTNIGQLFNYTNIKVFFDPDFTKISGRIKAISSEEKLLLHYPSIQNVKNKSVKLKLENYFLQDSSVKNQSRLLQVNFKKNIGCYNGLVDELESKFHGKNLYIVAAGPSLDKNFMKLMELKDDSIILATGTVLKKLLNAGVRPDYFIVTDANERVYAQINGLEKENIPMLYLSTAYYGFAYNYQGDKYMILQMEYDKSEQYAKEKRTNLYKTGGSVSTTALDVGIRLGCKKIIFLGLDLAFPNNYVHALGTSRRELSSTVNLRQVEDICGNMVYTSKSLDIYRQWIENRIEGVKDIEFIDATEGGAKIKGMIILELEKVIN